MRAGLDQPAARGVSLSSGPRSDLFPACVRGRWLRPPFGLWKTPYKRGLRRHLCSRRLKTRPH
ncbi:MAG: hypothetical protein KTR25_17510 [Myxococcales bacterium]|nr:hypothetical protein [Myxococcales bacterium]